MDQKHADKRLHARVTGRVQGVGFRYHTRSRARSFGLTGWVRNEADGSVSVEAEGSEKSLEEFANWLRKGPPSARVEDVDVRYTPARGTEGDFRVAH